MGWCRARRLRNGTADELKVNSTDPPKRDPCPKFPNSPDLLDTRSPPLSHQERKLHSPTPMNRNLSLCAPNPSLLLRVAESPSHEHESCQQAGEAIGGSRGGSGEAGRSDTTPSVDEGRWLVLKIWSSREQRGWDSTGWGGRWGKGRGRRGGRSRRLWGFGK